MRSNWGSFSDIAKQTPVWSRIGFLAMFLFCRRFERVNLKHPQGLVKVPNHVLKKAVWLGATDAAVF